MQAAQILFTQALQINPRYAPAYNNRAMLYILMGEETAAVQDYSLSLPQPQRWRCLLQPGLSLRNLG
jgi:Tfp pilus assembly protein PilF